MTTYHFGQDLLDTYQSMSFLLQTLWLIVPPVFIAVMFGLWLRYQLAKQQFPKHPLLHPFEIADEDIERVIAYPPPIKDAPLLIAVVGKEPSIFRQAQDEE